MSEIDQVAQIVAVLTSRHPEFARVTIERWVRLSFEAFESARVQTFVPVLVQRAVDARLRMLKEEPAGLAVPSGPSH